MYTLGAIGKRNLKNTHSFNQRSNSSLIQATVHDPYMESALHLNHRFVDKNIHETISRVNSYSIHQRKLDKMREDTFKKKLGGTVDVDSMVKLRKKNLGIIKEASNLHNA